MKNYYQTLGLTENSSTEEIKKAYKLFALKLHPDKHDGDKFFEARFKEVLEAYEILSDLEKKSSYDIKLKSRIVTDPKIRDKELILKSKEEELRIRERTLLKKLKEVELKKAELQKKEDEINLTKEQLSIDKIKNNENYSYISISELKPGIKKLIIRKWLKNIGEYVKKDEVIVRLESEKKEIIEIKSNSDGFLIYTVKIGKTLTLGSVVAIINK